MKPEQDAFDSEDGLHSRPLRILALRWAPLAAFILINVLFLLMLDTLFANKKRSLIIDSQGEFADIKNAVAAIQGPLQSLLNANRDTYLMRAQDYLDRQGMAFLEGDHPWFRIVLEDSDRNVVAEYVNRAKRSEYNRADNCFLSRSFEAPMVSSDLKLTLYYATPRDWPSIEAMTKRYWLYAALFVAATALAYWWLHRNVLFPLQRVGGAMQKMAAPGAAPLIAKPQHDIELAFNRLARLQREMHFGYEIEQLAGELHDLADDAAVLEAFLCGAALAIETIYPFKTARAFGYLRSEQRYAPLNGTDAGAAPGQFDDNAVRWLERGGVEIPLRIGDRWMGCFRCEQKANEAVREAEWHAMANEIQKQCENGLVRAFARSQAMIEERNRFGINLATNMGHDLTNIIATGKWDLNTIQQAQRLGIVQLNPERGSFYEEAIAGLKNNLYFLQEMVDIYRSFGYARRPRYEHVNLTELINDLARLFRLSTSREFEIEIAAPETLPATVEPRLLRMALFNLLANSSQAIQRGGGTGRIVVKLEEADAKAARISILDNGPGLRDKEGRLLTEEEAARIFRSGYSTKDGASGGGLGLAWVKSIVEEFHGGFINARNREESGACVWFEFPLSQIETAENEAAAKSN